VPYYTFKVPSTNKNVLAKQFTTQDCIDLHFLLANQDFEGVDLFCEKKFLEYTSCNCRLNSLDKFLFLFSQRILSHSFDISVNHVGSNDEKTTVTVSLVNIYNSIADTKFIINEIYKESNLEIEYGIPYNLSSKQRVNLYKIKTDKETFYDLNDKENFLEELPYQMNKQVNNMLLKNNELIKLEYFKKSFLRDLELNNECFLFILDFIYTENVGNHFTLSFNLCKEYNINYEHIKSITMRELQLIIDTINIINQEKKKKQKANERTL